LPRFALVPPARKHRHHPQVVRGALQPGHVVCRKRAIVLPELFVNLC